MTPESANQITVYELGVSPWLLMLALLVPLILLMIFGKTFPTGRLSLLGVLPFLMTLAIPWLPLWWWYSVVLIDALILLVAIADVWSLPNLTQIHVVRSMSRVASLDKPHPVEISIDNRGSRKLNMRLAEDASDRLVLDPPMHTISLVPGKRISVQQTVTAHRRGAFELEHLYCQVSSMLGLWRKQHVFDVRNDLHVYPDIKQISEYALLARTNRFEPDWCAKDKASGAGKRIRAVEGLSAG